ncbi:MAG: hypothetical protein WCV73_00690 [Patescibacteria group bacterium]|jgi:hypothetical protein
MEKEYLKSQLDEAALQLSEIIDKLKNQQDYDYTEFQIDIQHVIVHINTAYNIGTWSKEKLDKDYNDKFDELIRIPDDKYLIDHS